MGGGGLSANGNLAADQCIMGTLGSFSLSVTCNSTCNVTMASCSASHNTVSSFQGHSEARDGTLTYTDHILSHIRKTEKNRLKTAGQIKLLDNCRNHLGF